MPQPTSLLLGTRKGLLELKPSERGGTWEIVRESFVGAPVVFAFRDARTGTRWASLDHGHWGVKLHRSRDEGETWEEIAVPVYPEGLTVKDDKPAKMELIWFIAPGGADEPGRIYLGTKPGGVFTSDDGGSTFMLNRTLWDHPSRPEQWFGRGKDTPGAPSLWVDPRDSRKIVVGVSVGGVFVSEDGGKTWQGRNKGLRGDYMPDPYAEFGHDVHYMTHCAKDPDTWWQQNHCGIFVTRDAGRQWEDVSQKDGPARFGWAIAADPDDPKTAWVVPAQADDTRVAKDRRLFVCRTRDGGKTWEELRKGLPQRHAYDITYRHALDLAGTHLAFGTTTGNAYLSSDRGDAWIALGQNLPPVYSVRFT